MSNEKQLSDELERLGLTLEQVDAMGSAASVCFASCQCDGCKFTKLMSQIDPCVVMAIMASNLEVRQQIVRDAIGDQGGVVGR